MNGRLVIAGTQSGVGKTTIVVGLLDALRGRGLTVQPFKVGPDYIDPSYHTLAAGRTCRNLDTWMLPPTEVRASFFRAARTADLAVIEGVMGLFDGADYDSDAGSTAEVARLLEAPIVLVLDAGKIARSAAAVALGFCRFDERVPIAGFIVNRAASARHGEGIAAAVERATGLPVFGWLPRSEQLTLAERHLGLIPTAEPGRWADFVQAAGQAVTEHIDVDRIIAVARNAPPLEVPPTARTPHLAADAPVIAIARDEAFHFTYEDNLDLLREGGARLQFFSPLEDGRLPAGTRGIVLSGGFPELYAARLAANRPLHAALHAAHAAGLPIYAECGGLMFLTEAIVDGHRVCHAMVGLLPGFCLMTPRLTVGYRIARAASNSWLLVQGQTIRGHEFHHSAWQERPASLPPAFFVQPRGGREARPEGACVGNLWASYVHLHFRAQPELAERFVAACAAGGRR